MKLSDFKQKPFSKKVSFVNGVMTVIENESVLNGEITFYELDADRITSIYNDLMKSDEAFEKKTNEEFVFMLLPHICDIEIDVDADEYKDMLENPNADLLNLMSMLMDSLEEVLNIMNTFNDLNENVGDLKTKLNIKEETKEDKLKRLYEDLAITTNVDNIKVILSEIKKLEDD